MSRPKISVVTPSFNQGHFIEETICSVLDQGYPNLEYIIIDGGSNDGTIEVVKKYERHLHYWVSEPDKGQSNAINKGLAHCTGEIFNWLNSDDLLAVDALHIISDQFGDPSLDILSGHEIYFSSAGEQERKGSIIFPSVEENIINGVIYQPSTYWRMTALRPLLPLDADFHYLMDADLWIKYIMMNGISGIRKIETPLAKFRIHSDSKTSLFQERFQRERWHLRRWVYDVLEMRPHKYSKHMQEIAKDDRQVSDRFVSEHVSSKKLALRYAEELAYHYYVGEEYAKQKDVLSEAFSHGLYSKKLLSYYTKVNLLPRALLNVLRA